jgi:hypothetical protein
LFNCLELHVLKKDDWWIVFSNKNWMQHDCSIQDAFINLIPFPQGGIFYDRSEVFIYAFSTSIIVSEFNGDALLIKGDADEEFFYFLKEKMQGYFFVAFK